MYDQEIGYTISVEISEHLLDPTQLFACTWYLVRIGQPGRQPLPVLYSIATPPKRMTSLLTLQAGWTDLPIAVLRSLVLRKISQAQQANSKSKCCCPTADQKMHWGAYCRQCDPQEHRTNKSYYCTHSVQQQIQPN